MKSISNITTILASCMLGLVSSVVAQEEKANQRQVGGPARLLKGPDGQGKVGHAGAQQGNQLTNPDDGKTGHTGAGIFVGRRGSRGHKTKLEY